MSVKVSEMTLLEENQAYQQSPGISQNNRSMGFVPAFYDTDTGTSYLSRFANGRAAPVHVLDGLPDSLIVSRCADGTVRSVKASVISGFLYAGAFYTREQAVALVG